MTTRYYRHLDEDNPILAAAAYVEQQVKLAGIPDEVRRVIYDYERILLPRMEAVSPEDEWEDEKVLDLLRRLVTMRTSIERLRELGRSHPTLDAIHAEIDTFLVR